MLPLLLLLLTACPMVPPYEYAERDSSADTADTGEAEAAGEAAGDSPTGGSGG